MIPRTPLAILPTPLKPAHRLSEELGLEVWLKREDMTGLGLGGNKIRSLEYLIGEAEHQDADVLVTGGGPQSNWVMLAALAAVTRGMGVEIVYFGPPSPLEGNLLLVSRLPGVVYSFTGDPTRSSVDPALETVRERCAAAGRRPYVIGRGGAGPVGALGYLNATLELDAQVDALGITPATVWLSTGSCGTQAGLVAGHALSGSERLVVGVTVHRPASECRERIGSISRAALDLVGQTGNPVDWDVLDGQLDAGPAQTAAAQAAHDLCVRTEGIFLDPEFCAPAMAELMIRRSEVKGPVVFLLTGGAPTLFTTGAFT